MSALLADQQAEYPHEFLEEKEKSKGMHGLYFPG
jgi:hypothetical protein